MFNRASLVNSSRRLLKSLAVIRDISRGKKVVDKSLVPEIKESDLEEHFVKGGGPGGSKVNKAVNCVYLFHKPTGLQVKVHEHREQEKNRKLAREKIQGMLDNLINGEKSVENQIRAIEQEKTKKRLYKRKKLHEMKSRWRKLMSES